MNTDIQIIDVGIGNIASVFNMLRRIGAKSTFVADPQKISLSSKIILPGVGSFDAGINALRKNGMDEAVREAGSRGVYILGICLGMQLLCKNSEEGKEDGLGLIDAEVKKFNFPQNSKLKIPHMGWNHVSSQKDNALFLNMYQEPRFYFVHSYHVVCNELNDVITTTNYGYDFHSSFAHDNIMGVQFHPEKSHKFGMLLLKNFVENF